MTTAFPIRNLTFCGRTWHQVEVEMHEYEDGSTALRLTCVDDLYREPLATASLRLPQNPLPQGQIWVRDFGYSEGLGDALVQAGVIEMLEPTAKYGTHGQFEVHLAQVLAPYWTPKSYEELHKELELHIKNNNLEAAHQVLNTVRHQFPLGKKA